MQISEEHRKRIDAKNAADLAVSELIKTMAEGIKKDFTEGQRGSLLTGPATALAELITASKIQDKS